MLSTSECRLEILDLLMPYPLGEMLCTVRLLVLLLFLCRIKRLIEKDVRHDSRNIWVTFDGEFVGLLFVNVNASLRKRFDVDSHLHIVLDVTIREPFLDMLLDDLVLLGSEGAEEHSRVRWKLTKHTYISVNE